jgi:hypothetical protein
MTEEMILMETLLELQLKNLLRKSSVKKVFFHGMEPLRNLFIMEMDSK